MTDLLQLRRKSRVQNIEEEREREREKRVCGSQFSERENCVAAT